MRKRTRRFPFDLTGMRFHLLVAIKCVGKNRHGHAIWKCRCDCGKEVEMIRHSLVYQNRSCGHIGRENKARTRTHGYSKTSTYSSWKAMKKRCLNPNDKHYDRYGGRGIAICVRWLTFENFLKDMGEKPEGLTLERINNDGNYEPSNCRWATRQEQAYNTSVVQLITFEGQSLSLAGWARRSVVSQRTFRSRLRRGWDMSSALTTPTR